MDSFSPLKGFVATTECSYIDGLNATMEYIALEECPEDVYQSFLEHGWRRFGILHFRPICEGCTKCDSLRIVVEHFIPSKSMRKVKNKNKDTKVYLNRPNVSQEKIELYNKYHSERSEKKGWEYKQTGVKEYSDMLVGGKNNFAYEVLYIINGKLAGVDYIDIGLDGISAVYFITDPDFSKFSLGVFSLLVQIELAKKLGLKFIYLGYGVKENKSLNYKYRYKPLEILELPSKFGLKPVWNKIEYSTENS